MKGKSLVILAGAVLILGAFIWFFERNQLTTEEARAQEARVFAGLEEEAIVALNITNSHGAFSFQRRDGAWRLTDPIESNADDSAVSMVLRSLIRLDRDSTLGADEVDPKAYGLDHPEATVTLGITGGRTHTLTIGNATALGSNRAVSTGSEGVILTNGSFFAGIDKALDDWRSREIADVSLGQLAAITVRTGNGTIEAMNLNDTWLLRSPVNDRADRFHLQNLISGLNGLRVEEFVDSEADLATMSLANPTTTVLLVQGDGSPGLTLEFGSAREHGGATQIACRRNDTDIFWVNDRAVNALGKAPVLWRDKTVLAFDTWDVTSLGLSEGSTTVELKKESGIWRLGDGTEAFGEEVQKRLGALTALKAVDFDLMLIGTPELGRAVLARESTSIPITVSFFESFEEGGNVLVTVSGRDTVMSVAPDDVQSIVGDLQALRPGEPQEIPSPDNPSKTS